MLDFKPIEKHFDFGMGVESASADATEKSALAYMESITVIPFGGHTTFYGKFKRKKTKVLAFAAEFYLYVIRVDMKTKNARIYQYYAPYGILLAEAIKIGRWHHESHVDL